VFSAPLDFTRLRPERALSETRAGTAAHFATVEAQRQQGLQHACSTSDVLVIVFAIASLALATLTLAALRTHRRELGLKP
jgi:hypothetical protein